MHFKSPSMVLGQPVTRVFKVLLLITQVKNEVKMLNHYVAWNRWWSCVSCFRSGTGNGIARNRSESSWNHVSDSETFGTVMEARDSGLEASMDS